MLGMRKIRLRILMEGDDAVANVCTLFKVRILYDVSRTVKVHGHAEHTFFCPSRSPFLYYDASFIITNRISPKPIETMRLKKVSAATKNT